MPPINTPVRYFSLRVCQLLTTCLLIGMLQNAAVAQQPSHPSRDVRDYLAAGSRITAAPADRRIAAALKQVSTERIRANISALVNFVNRSTVSSTETDLPAGT